MGFLEVLIKTVGSIVAFIIAVKLVALVLWILGVALHLAWLLFWVFIFCLVAFAIYKIFAPNRAPSI
jgi:hypothetical protein